MRTPLLALLIATVLLPGSETQPTVFASASLTNAVTDLAKTYEEKTGIRVIANFAAASTLAKQIENGAPADLFMSADLTWMDYLMERKQIDAASRVDLLGNALVVIAPVGKGFAFKAEKDFPAEQAFAGRLAVGDPTNVPVGIYAKEAFMALGWWSWLEQRLAPTADVRAALRLVETGEADCGVVYATDAKASPKVEVIATVPGGLHKPVRYPVAATANAGPAARAFLAYLIGPEARPVYERYGFTVLR
jgi:molybdate transport system substrate-binding protein